MTAIDFLIACCLLAATYIFWPRRHSQFVVSLSTEAVTALRHRFIEALAPCVLGVPSSCDALTERCATVNRQLAELRSVMCSQSTPSSNQLDQAMAHALTPDADMLVAADVQLYALHPKGCRYTSLDGYESIIQQIVFYSEGGSIEITPGQLLAIIATVKQSLRPV